MNHLNDELIIQLIDGSLEENSQQETLKHISECDRCFVSYSSLKVSNLDITEVSLPQTPDSLIELAKSEMNVQDKTETRKVSVFIEKLYQLVNFIFYPRPVLIPVTITAVVAIAFLFINREGVGEGSNFDPTFKYPNMVFRSPDGKIERIMVPDLEPLKKETIIDSLTNMGLNYKILNSKQGFKQQPLPGDFLPPNDTVYIHWGSDD